jgi:hypothetical protein
MKIKNNFSKGKRGATGEAIVTIWRVILVGIIAFFIFGISAFTYSYSIDVRDMEGAIMIKKVVNCFSQDGTLKTSSLPKNGEEFLFNKCKIKGAERFFVKIQFNYTESGEFLVLEQGEGDLEWTKKIYEDEDLTNSIREFRPGVSKPLTVPLLIDGKDGKITVGVLVNP